MVRIRAGGLSIVRILRMDSHLFDTVSLLLNGDTKSALSSCVARLLGFVQASHQRWNITVKHATTQENQTKKPPRGMGRVGSKYGGR